MRDYFQTREPARNIYNQWPVARPGLIFILIPAGLALLALAFGLDCLPVIFGLAAAFCAWFFRDPQRPTPPPGFGLAPADGRIIRVERVEQNPYTPGPTMKVSIFMNLLSVHVNRIPVNGRLTGQTYFPGSFFNASFDKASEKNERNALVLETAEGPVALVQIAGLIARRIVSWVREGEVLERGQRFGLIRFGSRVDLYLPPDSEIMVGVGQKVTAGWSPLWRPGAVR
ncbi:MAG: phosphatidylserine decarboxylase family protein [Candidatus Adiutrix sp.]|jgi:phosphatidylserine decarboxylase|nr:phosphatidylserine decarboxylase family protein [Candidatus Adiutrix sp.]